MYSSWLDTSPGTSRVRGAAAELLRGASRWLARLARQLRAGRPPVECPVVLEFYAEAGAPEGALYVNGQLVGHLTGVTRL
jgi:hypothetical protein